MAIFLNFLTKKGAKTLGFFSFFKQTLECVETFPRRNMRSEALKKDFGKAIIQLFFSGLNIWTHSGPKQPWIWGGI